MSVVKLMCCVPRTSGAAFVSLASVIAATTALPAPAQAHEIIVTIHSVKALDRVDVTAADFYARVTIDGEIHLTKHIRQKNEIEPNWQIRQNVEPGRRDIAIEIWDKDLVADDMIDINGRTDKSKRHQDLGVNTRTCRVYGFGWPFRCGYRITRSGDEKKSAEVTFSVDVKR